MLQRRIKTHEMLGINLVAFSSYRNLSTSASSTRKSLFCTSLWIFWISSSSLCFSIFVFSFSGQKQGRENKRKKKDFRFQGAGQEKLQMSKNDLLMQVSGFADLSHQNPANSGCFLFSLLLVFSCLIWGVCQDYF